MQQRAHALSPVQEQPFESPPSSPPPVRERGFSNAAGLVAGVSSGNPFEDAADVAPPPLPLARARSASTAAALQQQQQQQQYLQPSYLQPPISPPTPPEQPPPIAAGADEPVRPPTLSMEEQLRSLQDQLNAQARQQSRSFSEGGGRRR